MTTTLSGPAHGGASPSSSSDAPITIQGTLSSYTSDIRRYILSSDHHPLWNPPIQFEGAASWAADEVATLLRLQMPAVLAGHANTKHKPDMLLYLLGHLGRLDAEFPGRLQQMVAGTDHIYITNASGSGKTRLIFETLATHWGFYFSCTANPRVDPYGSLDLQDALRFVGSTSLDGAPFSSEIPVMARLSPHWKRVADRNCRIADRCFNQVVLARLLVFDHFLNVLSESEVDDNTARLKWLLLQLRPMALLNVDIFSSLLSPVMELEDDEVLREIETLYDLHQSRIAFVAIDESNVAMQQYPGDFMSANYKRRVPVLRQLVNCMANRHPASRLLVAGTLLDEEVVSEPIRKSRSSSHSLRVFHSLGRFDSVERTSGYLRHFFDDLLSPADCRRAHAYFRGRHRILAVFVMYTLIYGTSRATQVMDTLVECTTGYKAAGVRILKDVSVGLIFRDSTLEDSGFPHQLRAAFLNYALHRRRTVFNTNAKELVGMSAGLYGDSVTSAEIYEPLIMLNLARWLASASRYGIHGLIQRRSVDRTYSVGAAGFVEGLACCVRDFFTVPLAPGLSSLLDFKGRPPEWAEHSARLVLPRLSHRRSRFAAYSAGSDVCVASASSPDDVFQWLDNAAHPFLIPDPGFGAALLFVIELADARRLLVCLDEQFLRDWGGGRVLRDHEVVPLRPSDFYKRDRASRARLFSALEHFSPDAPSRSQARRPPDVPAQKHNILNLLCFSRMSRAGTTYDPPAAELRVPFLLQQPRPVEFEMAHLLDTIDNDVT